MNCIQLKTVLWLRWSVFFSVCLIFVCHLPDLQASILYSYDLDSLVAMSSNVVAGDVVTNTGGSLKFNVKSVYKGGLRTNQMITVNASYYGKPDPKWHGQSTKGFETGDRLFLFLEASKSGNGESTVFSPVPSGIKAVVKGLVHNFSQYISRPGPYAMQDEIFWPKKFFPSDARFIDTLTQSVHDSDGWMRLLKSDTVASTWVLNLLAERSRSRERGCEDYIAEAACSNLIEHPDFPTLSKALSIDLTYRCKIILHLGFANHDGHAFLLHEIAMDSNPLIKKLEYVNCLIDAGGREDSAGSEGANYARQVAELAMNNVENPRLCTNLLRSAELLVNSLGQKQKVAGTNEVVSAQRTIQSVHAILESKPK